MENKGYLIYEVGILGGNDKGEIKFILFLMFYQINLERGSMVTICPYRILIDNNDRLTLTKENDIEEIIISKANYDFEEVTETTTEFTDNEELNIISVNAISKVKDTKLKR